MANKSITLNLTSGGGRQTLSQPAADTPVEITTTWSNNAEAKDSSEVKANFYWKFTPSDTWEDTDDYSADFESLLQSPSSPTVYVNGVENPNILLYWTYYAGYNYWDAGLDRSELPFQSTDYTVTFKFVFDTGEVFEWDVLVTGNP